MMPKSPIIWHPVANGRVKSTFRKTEYTMCQEGFKLELLNSDTNNKLERIDPWTEDSQITRNLLHLGFVLAV